MKSTTLAESFRASRRNTLSILICAIITAFSLLSVTYGQELGWRGGTDNVWTASGGGAIWAQGNNSGKGRSAFTNGATAIFDTGSSATGVNIRGTVAPSTLTLSSGANYTFTPQAGGSVQATGAINISGSLTLGATSSINTDSLPLLSTSSNSGITVNNGGSLILAGTGNHVGNTTNLTLSGGSLAFASSGFSETLGALTLTAPSTLDFSGTGSSITFSSISGSSVLHVFNFDPSDRLFLAQPTNATIYFYSGSDMNSPIVNYTAEVVPEPSTIIAGVGFLGFLGFRERRRLSSFLKQNERREGRPTS